MRIILSILLIGLSKALIPNPQSFFNIQLLSKTNPIDNNVLIHLPEKSGQDIISKIAQSIPNIDTIGHQVILLDRSLINYLINNHSIPSDLKKEIILVLIKISQEGDHIGTFVLNGFYKISDFLL